MGACDGFDIQISAYVDGELEGISATSVEAHLAECIACATRVERERRLQSALRATAPPRAPEALRSRVEAALRAAAPEPPHWRWQGVARWAGLAATLLLAVLAGRRWGADRMAHDDGPAIPESVLTAHIRSLQEEHLVDVRSSDQHAVKPWFTGRLDYSPPVPVLDSAGYRLVGARLDYVFDRPTAAIVYGRRDHVINLFLWPADAGAAPAQSRTARGYHWIHGTAGPVVFCVISDLNEAELQRFVALVQADLRGATRS